MPVSCSGFNKGDSLMRKAMHPVWLKHYGVLKKLVAMRKQ